MTIEHLPFDISSLHAAYSKGLTASDVVAEVYRRIATVDDPGIFITLFDPRQTDAQAVALGEFDPIGKPLWGVPFVVKDNIDIQDQQTTAGCEAFAYTPTENASVVTLLREAGAIVIGKTNLDQFATGLVGTRSPFPPPRNAVNASLVPGGSSSGSAVAVAHGIVSFSLGTDTAGSGRVPAALNNIVGLKPTLGRLSNRGVVPACRTLDTISIFALNVDDAYQVLTVASRYDADDPFSRELPLTPVTPDPATSLPLSNTRIGVPPVTNENFCGDQIQADAFTTTLQSLESQGATLVELDFNPFIEVADLLYSGAWVAERYSVIEKLLNDTPDDVHPVTRQVVNTAKGMTAVDAFRDRYRLASLRRQCEQLISETDALCVPTIPTPVTLEQIRADPIAPNTRLGRYTNFVNLLDMCAIAIPTAPRSDGLSGSATILAGSGQDHVSAAIASVLERVASLSPGVTGWSLPDNRSVASGDLKAATHEMSIAVVGAHMSGMPLNGELSRLGARKLSSTWTAAAYRLYALAGGPPARPGLARDESGTAIALEVWALPQTRVGEFLAGIPHPLGLGSVTLQDGSAVTGFICEPIGLRDATDVTEFGGWRNYMKEIQNRLP